MTEEFFKIWKEARCPVYFCMQPLYGSDGTILSSPEKCEMYKESNEKQLAEIQLRMKNAEERLKELD